MDFFKDIAIFQYARNTAAKAIDMLKALAEELHVSEIFIYIVAALLAITVAVFGYRIIKLICAFSLEPFGFAVGTALYAFLVNKLNLTFLPKFVSYIFAILFAILLCYLCFRKFKFVFFALTYMVVVDIFMSFTNDLTLSMGLALLAALVCVSLIRVSAVLITSFAGSFLTAALAGNVLTSVSFLQYQTNDIAIIIALALGVLFAVAQFVSAKYYKAR